jgi:hypothetical protein
VPLSGEARSARSPQSDVVTLDPEGQAPRHSLDRAFEPRVLEGADPPAAVADQVMVVLTARMGGLVERNAFSLNPVQEAEALEQLERAVHGRHADVAALRSQAIAIRGPLERCPASRSAASA